MPRNPPLFIDLIQAPHNVIRNVVDSIGTDEGTDVDGPSMLSTDSVVLAGRAGRVPNVEGARAKVT